MYAKCLHFCMSAQNSNRIQITKKKKMERETKTLYANGLIDTRINCAMKINITN